MGASNWFTDHWFDLLQTIGIVGSLLFSAYTTRRDEESRRIANLISINQEHRQIWKELYAHPELSRVTAKNVDLISAPVTDQEEVLVNSLIIHLDTVHRAIRSGLYVKIEGLQADIRDFFSLPIPKAVWNKVKPFQNADFVHYIEAARK